MNKVHSFPLAGLVAAVCAALFFNAPLSAAQASEPQYDPGLYQAMQ
jgi:hypothetical protein